VRQPPRRLLAGIPGLELVEMEESSLCCGSAGIYNVLQPGTADALQRRKVEHILASPAEAVVTGNPGCMIQLADGLRRCGSHMPVKHLVQVLDEALETNTHAG
jgi:glycolate oxidase iron-sulfur subunit